MNTVRAKAELETKICIVTQVLCNASNMIADDEDCQFTAVDNNLFDDLFNLQTVGFDQFFKNVDCVVEPATVGAWRFTGKERFLHQAGKSGRIGEHAFATRHQFGCTERTLQGFGYDLGVVRGDDFVTHARSPFIWWVGVAARAACSALRAIS